MTRLLHVRVDAAAVGKADSVMYTEGRALDWRSPFELQTKGDELCETMAALALQGLWGIKGDQTHYLRRPMDWQKSGGG